MNALTKSSIREAGSPSVSCNRALPLGGKRRCAASSEAAPFSRPVTRARSIHATFAWVPDDFLLRHGVQQWMEIPLWRVQRRE